jgi:hypothetical protein
MTSQQHFRAITMRTNCLGSLQAAMRDAGLEDKWNDIPPGIMAERLRPSPQLSPQAKSQTRPQPTHLAHLVATPAPSRGKTGIAAAGVWVLMLAFALGLIPSLAIGAVLWLDKSRTAAAYPCVMRTAGSPTIAPNLG